MKVQRGPRPCGNGVHPAVCSLFCRSSSDDDCDDTREDEDSTHKFDENEIEKHLNRYVTEILRVVRSEPFKRTHSLLSRGKKKACAQEIAVYALMRWASILFATDLYGYMSKIPSIIDERNIHALFNAQLNNPFQTFVTFPRNIQHFLFGMMSTYDSFAFESYSSRSIESIFILLQEHQ